MKQQFTDRLVLNVKCFFAKQTHFFRGKLSSLSMRLLGCLALDNDLLFMVSPLSKDSKDITKNLNK